MSRWDCHCATEPEALERNKAVEPLGEKIRAELIEFLERNKIVSVMLDTAEHCVSINIVRLPPRIKPVLKLWGSIFVRDDEELITASEELKTNVQP